MTNESQWKILYMHAAKPAKISMPFRALKIEFAMYRLWSSRNRPCFDNKHEAKTISKKCQPRHSARKRRARFVRVFPPESITRYTVSSFWQDFHNIETFTWGTAMRNRLYSSSPYNDDGGEEVTTMRERSDWGDVVIMHKSCTEKRDSEIL